MLVRQRVYHFNCDRKSFVLRLCFEKKRKKPFIFRLERWQQEQFLSQTLGAHFEVDEESTSSTTPRMRSAAAQTVWLKFEAERNTRDAAYQLIRLRRKLGLPNQLPIHGPGGQQAMKEQLKKAEKEQVEPIIRFVFLFYSFSFFF